MAKPGSVVAKCSPCKGMFVAHVNVWMHQWFEVVFFFYIYLWYLPALSTAISHPHGKINGNVCCETLVLCCILKLLPVIYFQYMIKISCVYMKWNPCLFLKDVRVCILRHKWCQILILAIMWANCLLYFVADAPLVPVSERWHLSSSCPLPLQENFSTWGVASVSAPPNDPTTVSFWNLVAGAIFHSWLNWYGPRCSQTGGV